MKEKIEEWDIKMKKGKSAIKNLIIFLVLIFITFYILLKEQNLTATLSILSEVKLRFIFIALLCMCLYFICDAINIGRMLKTLNEKTSFIKNIKYSLIGFFYSSITPAASGGQPMQVYYMYKDNINVANSTLTFLINLSCMQVVTISLAIFSLFFNHSNLNPALMILFFIGIGLNLSALILLLIAILSKKLTNGIVVLVIKILKFFRFKNIDNKKEKLENELSKYQESAVYIKNNKLVVLKNLITTYLQFISLYSITYWVYCSFGLSEYSIFKIITMQSMLYATVSGIPSPGAVGVTEGGFLGIFKDVFPIDALHSAVLVNRGISFYLFVIISSIVVVIFSLKQKNEKTESETEEKS